MRAALIPTTISRRLRAAWSPLAWFAAGEQGAWYDSSDMSSMFQDSTGATPVTAVEQPVGLMLDKRLGLTMGPERVANGTFSDASGWSLGSGWSVGGGQLVFTLGSIGNAVYSGGVSSSIGVLHKVTFDIVARTNTNQYFDLGGGGNYVQIPAGTGQKTLYLPSTSAGGLLVIRNGDASAAITLDNISIREIPGNHASQATSTSRPTLRARYNLLLASATLATQNVTTLAANYQLRFSGAGTVTLSGTGSGVYSAGTHTITCTAGTLTLTVAGSVTSADLLNATDSALPYQWITTATSYDTSASFPPYLAFDGTDDGMATGSIDFSATDKMTVVAGITKLSDAAQGMLVELTASAAANAGAFAITAPDGASATFAGYSRGSAAVVSASAGSNAAPRKTVVTLKADIAGDAIDLRVAGASAATSATDQGTGNYSNAVLYIGRRGGSTLPVNGRLYQLVIRGAATADVTPGESHAATKSGVTL